MLTEVKKYGVGSASIDAPFPFYIHQLPLLTFGGLRGQTALAIVYNSRRGRFESNVEQNPFFFKSGFQLNMQKKILHYTSFSDTCLAYMQNADGSLLYFWGNGNTAISWDKQAVMVKSSTTTTIRYQDNSREVYNSNGDLTHVYNNRGTLIYTYTYNSSQQLTKIQDVLGRTINLTYANNALSNISVSSSGITSFSADIEYTTNTVQVKLPAGVSVIYELSGENATIYSQDTGGTYQHYCEKFVLSNSANQIVIQKYFGSRLADRNTFTFYPSSADENVASLIQKQDINGVLTRYQYDGIIQEYSYEAYSSNGSMFESDNMTNAYGMFKSDVTITKPTSLFGIIKENFELAASWGSTFLGGLYKKVTIPLSNGKNRITVSGWIKSSSAETSTTIKVSTSSWGTSPLFEFTVTPPVTNEWFFFSRDFSTSWSTTENTNLYVCFSRPASSGFEYGDVRLTPLSRNLVSFGGYLYRGVEKIYLTSVTQVRYTRNGTTSTRVCSLTFNDLYRRFIEAAWGNTENNLYCSDLTVVIPNCTNLEIQYTDWGSSYWITASEWNLGMMSRNVPRTVYQELLFNSGSSPFLTINKRVIDALSINYFTETYDRYLTPLASTAGPIEETVTSNSYGFPTQKRVSSGTSAITESSAYTSNGDFLASQTSPEGNTTQFSYDTFWGDLKSTTLPSGMVRNFVYDLTMSAVTNIKNTFGSTTVQTNITHTNGNVSQEKQGDVSFAYTYTYGRTSTVKANSNNLLGLSYANNDLTVTKKHYVQPATYYSVKTELDVYGRPKKFYMGTSLSCETFYSLPRYFDLEDTGPSNSSAILRYIKDYTKNQTICLSYNGNLINNILTINNSTEDLAQLENYVYDSLYRLSSTTFIKDTLACKSTLSYLANDNNPALNGKLSSFKWFIGSNQILDSSYNYDVFGRQTVVYYDLGNMFSQILTYYSSGTNTSNRIASVTHRNLSSGVTTNTTNYTYNSNGQITAETDSTTNASTTYQYDGFGRLVRENNSRINTTFLYTYNSNGCLSNIQSFPYTTDATPGGTSSSKALTYKSTNPTVLASFNGIAVTSNDQGVISAYNGRSFTWSFGRLTKIVEGTKTYEYSYDVFGKRVAKSFSDTANYSAQNVVVSYTINYTYDYEGRLVFEEGTERLSNNSTNTWVSKFLYSASGVQGCVFTLNGATTTYYYRTNLQGDVCDVFTSIGTSVGRYSSDAFGNTHVVSSNSFVQKYNPFRYRSYYFDSDTGYYWLSSRYYNPEWRRFLSIDSSDFLSPQTVGGMDLFAYCNNDPVNFVDPSGHVVLTIGALLAIGFGVGALVGAGASVISQFVSNDYSFDNFSWAQFAWDAAIGGISGALSVLPLGTVAMTISNAILSAVGTAGYHLLQNDEFTDEVWFDIAFSAVLGGIAGAVGGQGATGKDTITSTMSNPLVENAKKSYSKVITKIANGSYKSLGTAAYALRRSSANLAAKCGIAFVQEAGKSLRKSLIKSSICLLAGSATKGVFGDIFDNIAQLWR